MSDGDNWAEGIGYPDGCGFCGKMTRISATREDGARFEPEETWGGFGGNAHLVELGGLWYLRYTNTGRIFENYIEIDELYPVHYCPMCGREL